ncbi:MAG TPA: carboxylesterase, partial [Vicinamibacteria bacterium]|nr:carboxylesterase [Vicinamibacteria bacterium]
LVRALLEREEQSGIPSDRLVVAGFSQGAAVALFTGVRFPRRLAGILALSGYEVLPEARYEATPENASTPIFFGHGTYDPLVPVARGRAAHAAYAQGREALWREYPIEHSVSMDEIEEVGEWLRNRLP